MHRPLHGADKRNLQKNDRRSCHHYRSAFAHCWSWRYLQQFRLIVPDGVTPLIIMLHILRLGVQPGLVPFGLDIPYPLRHCGHQADGQTQQSCPPCE